MEEVDSDVHAVSETERLPQIQYHTFGKLVIFSYEGQYVDAALLPDEADKLVEIKHGTTQGAKYCGCEKCYKARSDYMKAYRKANPRKGK